MTKLYVAEFLGLASGDQGTDVPEVCVPPTAEQVVNFGGTTGGIATLGAITQGTLYTAGQYNNVPLTGGTGSGAFANITVAGGAVTAVVLVNYGNGYTAADVLSAAAANIGGTGSGFSIPVATITFASTPFQQTTKWVEVSADSICSIAWGFNPVATVGNCRLNVGERKLVRVINPSQIYSTVGPPNTGPDYPSPQVPQLSTMRVSVITNT